MKHELSPDKLGGSFPTKSAGQTVLIYDNKTTGLARPFSSPSDASVTVSMLLDQAVTLLVKWAPQRDAADAALATINGAAQTGEVTTAGTFFRRNVLLGPGRTQISVLMGTPAPTANYIAAERNTFDGLIQ